MKKENLKKLLKNIYMGVATASLLGIVGIIIFIITMNIQISQIDSTELLDALNDSGSLTSSIIDWSNFNYNNTDTELTAQYPNLEKITLIFTTLAIVISQFIDYVRMLTFAGILGGIVYYNIWGKEFEIKNSLKKIILNYLLIELISFIIVTIYGVIVQGATISGLFDMYTTTAIFYTVTYILVFVLNYLNNKRLTKKLNNNL